MRKLAPSVGRGPGRPALILVVALLSCSAGSQAGRGDHQATVSQQQAAGPAVAALVAGRFDEAGQAAQAVLRTDGNNPRAHAVQALVRYKAATHQFRLDLESVLAGGLRGGINQQYLSFALGHADSALSAVDADLAAAGADPGFSLELCPACWEVDWNGNGRIDEGDRHLFEIEQDQGGQPLPEADQRRRPTYRFDLGDLYWARALLAFQRAALNLLGAYRFSDLNTQLAALRSGPPAGTVTIGLLDAQKVAQARRLILDGLLHSERCRKEYLAETDDDREWVPNPRQKDHPLPLPVDEALYRTWDGVLGDLRRLVRGEEGLSLAALAQLGRHQWDRPPTGYLNLGALLAQPRDIVIEVVQLEPLERRMADATPALKKLLGLGYAERMRPSPLLDRLLRMSGEVDRGEESLERKLRYLFWLN